MWLAVLWLVWLLHNEIIFRAADQFDRDNLIAGLNSVSVLELDCNKVKGLGSRSLNGKPF